jgi:hypothetical protein
VNRHHFAARALSEIATIRKSARFFPDISPGKKRRPSLAGGGRGLPQLAALKPARASLALARIEERTMNAVVARCQPAVCGKKKVGGASPRPGDPAPRRSRGA